MRNWKLIAALLVATVSLTMIIGCSNKEAAKKTPLEETAGQETAEAAHTDSAADKAEQQANEAGTSAAAAPGIMEEQYQPNPEYDKYAMVDYVVEDIGAEFTATVSKKADDAGYEVHCMVDNEEQIVFLDKDLAIVSVQAGNLEYDAPLIVQKAIDEDNWKDITK